MPQWTVVLDPDGYFYASEPGIMLQFTGAELWKKQAKATGALPLAAQGSDKLYNPPGSEWLMMRPHQLSEEYFDPAVAGHEFATYRQSETTFNTDISTIEFDMALKPGELPNVNSDWWQTISRTPDTIADMDGLNYSALATAAGVNLPSGFKSVLFVDETPAAAGTPQSLADALYTPTLRWLSQPWPDTSFVFGFADIAFLVTGDVCYVLRTPQNDKQSWEMLGQVKAGQAPSPGQPHSQRRSGQDSMMQAPLVYGIPQMLVVYPVGYDTFYVHFGSSQPFWFKARKPIDTNPLRYTTVMAGTFWLGLAPKARFSYQLQCTAYDAFGAELAIPPSDTLEYLFDLGENYKPTEDPILALSTFYQWRLGHPDPLPTDETGTGSGPFVRTVFGSSSEEEVGFEFTDESAATWDSDGTHSQAYFKLSMKPGSYGGGLDPGFLTPYVRGLQLRFPPHLEPRVNSPLTLTDMQVHSWSAETGLQDAEGKRIEIIIKPEAVGLLLDDPGNFDYRDGFPVHIVESGIVRVAGWVDAMDLEELWAEDEITRAIALRGYKLTAKGLLSRADVGWLYLPQLVNPDGLGYIEHTWIVAEVLNGCGFDTTDTDVYLADTDPYASEALAQLPGTWGATTGTTGQDDEGAHNPDYANTKLEYLQWLTVEFRGWRLYEELNGRLRYAPDPVYLYGVGGNEYASAAVLYRTSAEAASNGLPGQYMLAQPTRTILKPTGNHLRISGQGDDAENFPHVIDSDPSCWTDIDNENFTGEPVPRAYASKLAVEKIKVSALARIALILNKQRRSVWGQSTPLASWQIGASGVVLGNVIAQAGDTRPNAWLAHVEVFCQKRDQYTTRLSLNRISDGNSPL